MFNTGPSRKTAASQAAPSLTATSGAARRDGRGATREQILDTAIEMFRRDGFEETTMREVAARAGLALGLTYYYFPSKEALVMAYYERVQREHDRLARERLPRLRSLRERLEMLLETKLEILKHDRRLLGAVFRYTGESDHPLSFLGKGTAPLRRQGRDLFAAALEGEKLPEDLRRLLPLALWALQMGVLLYFLYDRSPFSRRTRALAANSVALGVSALRLAKLPLLRPARRGVMNLLEEAGLLEG